jgi:hypothetical protein
MATSAGAFVEALRDAAFVYGNEEEQNDLPLAVMFVDLLSIYCQAPLAFAFSTRLTDGGLVAPISTSPAPQEPIQDPACNSMARFGPEQQPIHLHVRALPGAPERAVADALEDIEEVRRTLEVQWQLDDPIWQRLHDGLARLCAKPNDNHVSPITRSESQDGPPAPDLIHRAWEIAARVNIPVSDTVRRDNGIKRALGICRFFDPLGGGWCLRPVAAGPRLSEAFLDPVLRSFATGFVNWGVTDEGPVIAVPFHFDGSAWMVTLVVPAEWKDRPKLLWTYSVALAGAFNRIREKLDSQLNQIALELARVGLRDGGCIESVNTQWQHVSRYFPRPAPRLVKTPARNQAGVRARKLDFRGEQYSLEVETADLPWTRDGGGYRIPQDGEGRALWAPTSSGDEFARDNFVLRLRDILKTTVPDASRTSVEGVLWRVLLCIPMAPQVPFSNPFACHDYEDAVKVQGWEEFLAAIGGVRERLNLPDDSSAWDLMKDLIVTNRILYERITERPLSLRQVIAYDWNRLGVHYEHPLRHEGTRSYFQALLGILAEPERLELPGGPVSYDLCAPCSIQLRFFAPLAEFVHRLRMDTALKWNGADPDLRFQLRMQAGESRALRVVRSVKKTKSGQACVRRWYAHASERDHVGTRCNWYYDLDILAHGDPGRRLWQIGYSARVGSRSLRGGLGGSYPIYAVLGRLLRCQAPDKIDLQQWGGAEGAAQLISELDATSDVGDMMELDPVTCREVISPAGYNGLRLSWVGSCDMPPRAEE